MMSAPKRRRTGKDIRAKATNGNIRSTWTLTQANVTVTQGNTDGIPLDPEDITKYTKWSLWRANNDKYIIFDGVEEPDDGAHLVGLIESITGRGKRTTGHVWSITASMRGVIHVPIKFFTKTAYAKCEHPLWGKVYERIAYDESAFGTIGDAEEFTPGKTRANKLVRVFFRM